MRKHLRSYPVFAAPFSGKPRSLTLEQAEANLDYLLAVRPQRIAVLQSLLEKYGVSLPDDLAGCELAPLLEAINGWAVAEWSAVFDGAIASRDVWLASSRAGPEIVYSMLMDVAILFGELVVRRRPRYRWLLDLDRVNDEDGMDSFMRPVVQIPQGGPFPAPIIADFEATAVHMYLNPASPTYRVGRELIRGVEEAVTGAHERHWLAP